MALTEPASVGFINHAHHVEIYVNCPGMTRIEIYRTFDTNTYPMMWYQGYVPTGGRWQGVDAEPPSGTTTYTIQCRDQTIAPPVIATASHDFDHGGDFFFELGLVPDSGRLLNVESFETETHRAIGRQVLNVLHRSDPIAVTYSRSYPDGQLVLLTLNDDERRWVEKMVYTGRLLVFIPRLNAHTSSPKYLSLGDVDEERTTHFVHEDSRRFLIDVQQVARPPVNPPYIPVSPFVGNKWSDVEAFGTWQQLEDTGDEWQEISDLPIGAED